MLPCWLGTPFRKWQTGLVSWNFQLVMNKLHSQYEWGSLLTDDWAFSVYRNKLIVQYWLIIIYTLHGILSHDATLFQSVLGNFYRLRERIKNIFWALNKYSFVLFFESCRRHCNITMYLRVLISGCRSIRLEKRGSRGDEWLSEATWPYFFVIHLIKFLLVSFRNGPIIASLFLQWAMTSKGQPTRQQFLKRCGILVLPASWQV